MRYSRLVLPILIPIISLAYAIGDYYGWWDHLFGREIALKGVARLASPKNFPHIVIFDDEYEFECLLDLILSNARNKKIIDLYEKGTLPTAIVRVGGTLQPDVGKGLPENWPNPNFAPPSSPVAVVYHYHRPAGSVSNENIEAVGNLRDLRDWISNSRNRERFVVSALLLSLLSIAVVIVDQTRPNQNKRSGEKCSEGNASSKMNQTKATIGFPKEWDHFFKKHPRWPEKFGLLHRTLETVFIREFEPNNPADKVVFFLGRLVVEDFNEIFLLCGNGYGFGALKLLRGLYEKIVTAAYIAKNPDEAERYLDYHFIHKNKMLEHATDIDKLIPRKEIEQTKKSYEKVKKKFQETVCKKCKKQRTQMSWSKLDILSMAKKAGLSDDLYFRCYYYPTLQTHATPTSIMSRFKVKDEKGLSFNEGSQRNWADSALIAAHNLMIRLLLMQNDYFRLNIDSEIEDRKQDFIIIWNQIRKT